MSGTVNNGTGGNQPAANGAGQLAALAAPTLPSNISAALTPDKFDGTNFKQWQQKMHFFLTTLNLAKYLVETKPQMPAEQEANPDPRVHMTLENWEQGDFLCRGYIQSRLVDQLFNVYSEVKTAKELWEALDKKYKTFNVGSGKFAAAKFLNFVMVDSKPIMDQVHDLQMILQEISDEGMKICETFTVNCFIEKLPPGWADFKNYLAFKQKALTLANLISRLQNESLKRERAETVQTHDANVAEFRSKPKGRFNPNKGPLNKVANQASTGFKKQAQSPQFPKKKSGFSGKCNHCGKVGHRGADCRSKAKEKNQANLTEDDMVAVVTEANMVEENPMLWWYDTGATTHICIDRQMFSTYQKSKEDARLLMGNVSHSKIEGTGKVVLKMTSGRELTLNNVKHVPDMRKNLISGTLMSKHGFAINFESDQLILRKNGVFIGKGFVKDGLIKMCVSPVQRNIVVPVSNDLINKKPVAYLVESSNIWHERLGHVNYKSIERLMNLDLIPKCKINKDKCEICVQAKLTKTPSPHVERTTEPLGLIHTDLCDLKYVQTRGGKKYFVTFIDDCTRYCYVYLLRSKDEVLEKFKEYKTEVENQLGKTIKMVRSDRGGEYDGPFNAFCQEKGIIHQTTAPYSPESNGVSERKNRTLKEMMNAMLQESGLPQNLWGEALLATNYILNKIPHKVTGKTPYELWKGSAPSYKYLKVWGCLAKVQVPPPKKVSIGPKTVDCIFIGYAHNSSAYRFLVHKSDIPDIHANTIIESRNVSFFENIFPCKDRQKLKRTHDAIVPANETSTSGTSVTEAEENEVEPRRSKRARKEKSFGDEYLVVFLCENEPRTYSEAMSTPEADLWKEAVNSEMDSILQNHTYIITDLPPGFKALGCRWIFKTKLKTDGAIDKYKARLVVQGFRQVEGLDFFDTYSPVTRITSIRILIAIASLRDLEIHQMDVKTAFLNGDLEEEIYMKQPEGFVTPGQEHKVCKLVKSLYGLKQAPKQWHEKFDHVMMSNGFSINECDKCIYVKNTPSGYVLLCLYVDDMLIMGSNKDIIQQTKNMLKSQFDMKDMGLADVILGIKITRTSEGITLSQEHYAEKILERFKKYSNGTAKTPVDTQLHLTKNSGEGVSQVEYARIIGSLMYLTNCTRPDLAHAVNVLSRYTSNPGHTHWKAITRVLNYVRHTKSYGLHYGKEPAVLEGYSDANWISDSKNSKSTSGYVFTLGGAAISWKSSKQTLLARSTMESEFIALDKAAEEAEWLRNFLEDIPMWEKPVPALRVHCDSQSAIARALNTLYNGKSRHIRRRHKTIRHLITTGVISVDYIKSADNLADPFTKGLTRDQVLKSSKGMGLLPMTKEDV
ncbi:unnamed protein product [Microthlaspi erraticum]|uniref:Integrase catalytic domain-containing protein n=2 Tax=Microthlaspi erraticum TaxID=1685480 RepID=A0A6D2I600_9BRAS|nr:unnamed protein product [Microthlaspi erraticum]